MEKPPRSRAASHCSQILEHNLIITLAEVLDGFGIDEILITHVIQNIPTVLHIITVRVAPDQFREEQASLTPITPGLEGHVAEIQARFQIAIRQQKRGLVVFLGSLLALIGSQIFFLEASSLELS